MEIDQSFYGVVLLLQKWTSWLYEGHHGFLEVSWKHQAILAKNLMLLVHRLKLEDNWTSSGTIIPNYTYKSTGASFRDVIKCSQLLHQCNTQILFRIQICICYRKKLKCAFFMVSKDPVSIQDLLFSKTSTTCSCYILVAFVNYKNKVIIS